MCGRTQCQLYEASSVWLPLQIQQYVDDGIAVLSVLVLFVVVYFHSRSAFSSTHVPATSTLVLTLHLLTIQSMWGRVHQSHPITDQPLNFVFSHNMSMCMHV